MDYLTADEIAEILGISPKSARKIIRDHIKHFRVGRDEYRVARKDFDCFINAKKIKP